MKRKITQISGATIGYIMDDFPGAVKGYVYAGRVYDYVYPNKKQMAPIPFEVDTLVGQKGGSYAPQTISAGVMKFHANPPLKRTIKGSVEYWDYYNYEISWSNSSKSFTPVVHIGARRQYSSNLDHPNMSPFASRRWFDLQATQGQVAGNFTPARVAPNSDWIGVSKADIKMDFINLSTLPSWVRVTWYRCMEDSDTSILETYVKSTENNKLFTNDLITNPATVDDPLQAGNETVLSYTAGTTAVAENMTTMPYINLSSRKEVREKWKKLATKSFVMAGGSTFQLFTRGDVNVFQNFQSVAEGTYEWFNGMVVGVVECQGLASHLKIPAETGQVAIDGPSLAAGRIGVIVSRHLNIKAMTPSVMKWDSTFVGIGSLPIRGAVVQNETVRDVNMQTEVNEEET